MTKIELVQDFVMELNHGQRFRANELTYLGVSRGSIGRALRKLVNSGAVVVIRPGKTGPGNAALYERHDPGSFVPSPMPQRSGIFRRFWDRCVRVFARAA